MDQNIFINLIKYNNTADKLIQYQKKNFIILLLIRYYDVST